MMRNMRKNHSSPARAAFALLAAAAIALPACSSAPQQKAEAAQKTTQRQAVYKAEKPSPEAVENSPCGNPDWAQLPEGAEEKLPQNNAEPDSQTTEASPEHTKNAAFAAGVEPCT
jgi:hypothetical protein